MAIVGCYINSPSCGMVRALQSWCPCVFVLTFSILLSTRHRSRDSLIVKLAYYNSQSSVSVFHCNLLKHVQCVLGEIRSASNAWLRANLLGVH